MTRLEVLSEFIQLVRHIYCAVLLLKPPWMSPQIYQCTVFSECGGSVIEDWRAYDGRIWADRSTSADPTLLRGIRPGMGDKYKVLTVLLRWWLRWQNYPNQTGTIQWTFFNLDSNVYLPVCAWTAWKIKGRMAFSRLIVLHIQNKISNCPFDIWPDYHQNGLSHEIFI